MEIALESGEVISGIDVAKSFWRRAAGLFHKKSKVANGLLLYPCNAIHTFLMEKVIDVIFISSSFKIIKISSGVRSNQIRFCVGAFYVLELPEGASEIYKIKKGDRLAFS